MKRKRNKDQRGFTLIELVVAILIMSIVMVAAAGFLVTAANSYRVSNTEIRLQNEAQTVMNQINDILLEADSFAFLPAGAAAERLKVEVYEAEADGSYRLHHYEFQNDPAGERLMLTKDAEAPALLAQYFRSFQVKPEVRPGADEPQLVTVTLNFAYGGKKYSTTSQISLRNK